MRKSLPIASVLLLAVAGFGVGGPDDPADCWVQERALKVKWEWGNLLFFGPLREGHTFIVCRYFNFHDEINEDNWASEGTSKKEYKRGTTKSLVMWGGRYSGVVKKLKRKYVEECKLEGHRLMKKRTGGKYPDKPSPGGYGKGEKGYKLNILSPTSGNNCRAWTETVFNCLKAHSGLK